jgi:hypothetical protein
VASSDLKLREAERKQADVEAVEAQKALDAARRDSDAILNKPLPKVNATPRDVVTRAFARLRDDVTFYSAHRAELDRLINADAGLKTRFHASCKRYVQLGVLKPEGEGFAIRSVDAAGGPTRYERNLLQRMHAEIITQVLFPRLLSHDFHMNFVDQRLAARKEWRDVYHYDKDHRLTGWTRYTADGMQDFTPAGLLVLEKDEQGRVRKARAVKYVVEFIDRNAFIHTVKAVPGDKQVIFEYGTDGKVSEREEKIEKKE